MSKCRGNEWACKRSCSSDLGDLVQQLTPPSMAYVWQRNNRDRSCIKSLYGNIYILYYIASPRTIKLHTYSPLSILHNTYLVECRFTHGSWALQTIYDTIDLQYDNIFSVLHTLTGFVWTSYWSLLDLSRIQLLNISYVHSVLFSDDKWWLLTSIISNIYVCCE